LRYLPTNVAEVELARMAASRLETMGGQPKGAK
jgi:hypothetical protein